MFYDINNFNFPVGSREYLDIVKQREEELKDKDEYVLCFKNEFHEDIKNTNFQESRDLFFIPFLDKPSNLTKFPPFNSFFIETSFLPNMIASIKNLYWLKRSEADMNPTYSQLVCGIRLIDECGNTLLLKNKDTSDMKDTYGFIQGHISFNSGFYTETFKEYFLRELSREVDEEIRYHESFLHDLETCKFGVINTSTTLIDTMHTGLFIIAKVKDLHKYDIVSNEPHKHEVVIMTTDEMNKNADKLDNWVRELIQ